MELRKDYILDRWVIISEHRGVRPREFRKEPVKPKEGEVCFFCPGNEKLTPPEIYRTGGEDWKIRVFPNKFAAVEEEGNPGIKTENTYFSFAAPYGKHEVVVEAREHDRQLWDLSDEELTEVIRVYQLRIEALSKHPHAKYVVLFKNHGKEGGTSLVHTHTQILSFNKVPELVKDEVETSKRFGKCPFCDIIKIEKDSDRRCFENEHFVAFCPYASRFNFEVWIFPKKHITTLLGVDDSMRPALAEILGKVIGKLKELNSSFNFTLHYAPEGEDLHMHFEILPRLATWAGFELGTNVTINSVPPETAAKFYRGELEH
ncbi:MAG: galactose-1-phosphate uridylyltransferase [Nanoarchaeota archaeon]|nr:galactose-1-phosphate uridylyltransferase [Nanoarchaeota archaeon]